MNEAPRASRSGSIWKKAAFASLFSFMFIVGGVASWLLLGHAGSNTNKMSMISEETVQSSVASIIKNIAPSVVSIVVSNKNNSPTSRGSGFFISQNIVATNAHVVGGGENFTVKTHEGMSYPASLYDTNPELDLALLEVEGTTGNVPILSFSEKFPESGDDILVIGSPLGYEQTISNGIVSAVRRYDDNLVVIQITAPISPGSSGSPVVNMKGDVVGVATQTNTEGQNLNFAVSLQSVTPVLREGEEYLLKADAPTLYDETNVDSLRNTRKAQENVLRSKPDESVSVITSKNMGIRTIVKARSLKSGESFWVDSSFVKKEPQITLDKYIERFNETGFLLGSGASLSISHFKETTPLHYEYREDENYIQVENSPQGIIDQLTVTISNAGSAKSLEEHPWVLQSVGAFYPNSILADNLTGLVRDLAAMGFSSALGSLLNIGGGAYIEKFPVLFEMSSQAKKCQLAIFAGKRQKPKSAFVNVGDREKQKTRVEKSNVRDKDYLNSIRPIIAGMGATPLEGDSSFLYHPGERALQATSSTAVAPIIFHERKTGDVFAFIFLGFSRSSWVFAEEIIINCDGEIFTFKIGGLDCFEVTRDVMWGGKVLEQYALRLSANHNALEVLNRKGIALVRAMNTAKSVKVRFSGSRRNHDATVSKNSVNRIVKYYAAYEKLAKLEDNWVE